MLKPITINLNLNTPENDFFPYYSPDYILFPNFLESFRNGILYEIFKRFYLCPDVYTVLLKRKKLTKNDVKNGRSN